VRFTSPANEHLRQMAARIDKQAKEIQQLGTAGQDITAATQRLSLMQRAMDEMRLQLGQLSPTIRDTKRPGGTAANPAKPAAKK
jgi:hypothetical protein